MKKELVKFLEENIKLDNPKTNFDFDKLLEKPKIQTHGDFSLPCFLFAKELGKNPAQISKEFEDKLNNEIKMPEFLEKIQATGPFLNFYFNSRKESKDVINSILNKEIFNFEDKIQLQKILLEYPSPNTNKSLHIGHVRNILIGNSLSKIFKKVGHSVIKTNMNNDRGIAICKSMLGYELFFKDKTPQSLNLKSDEFVSKCYVEFEKQAKLDNSLNERAQNLLVKWEAEDEETIELWKKVMNLVFEGYKQTYEKFKLKNFDKQYYESQIYKEGKDIVVNALENNVLGFQKDETGAILCDLEDKGFDKKYLLRGDGTSLYMTQDLYLASLKEKEFAPDKSIFIVGKDQEYHFKVLFEILDRLGFAGNEKNFHFAYGYVYNRDGKKFSSRKGEVVGADWMYDLIVERAKENLLNKDKTKDLSEDELDKRAKVIGYSALCFSMLKASPYDDIKFDVEKALEMSGESGPYVQYTFARINSILNKTNFDVENVDFENLDFSLFGEREKSLIKLLKNYNDIVVESAIKYKISSIANYLIKVCQNFNDFYQNSNIINSDENLKNVLLVLCYATSKIIKDGLDLLDIDILDEM